MESSDLFGLFIIYYVLGCITVAVELSKRGWGIARVFFVSLLASPIVGAIIFSHYKRS